MEGTLEIGVKELRDNLSRWLAAVRGGGQVLITDRGKPVARLSGVSYTPAMERLIAEGAITPARKAKTPAGRGVKSRGSVSELVSEQRNR